MFLLFILSILFLIASAKHKHVISIDADLWCFVSSRTPQLHLVPAAD